MMKTNKLETHTPVAFGWLDNSFGMALMALVWSLSNPFTSEYPFD